MYFLLVGRSEGDKIKLKKKDGFATRRTNHVGAGTEKKVFCGCNAINKEWLFVFDWRLFIYKMCCDIRLFVPNKLISQFNTTFTLIY
ncbi:MAG: hypothetical protein ACI8RD_004346 [Bacillariaceae sp.]|jgi:hypothetical protein